MLPEGKEKAFLTTHSWQKKGFKRENGRNAIPNYPFAKRSFWNYREKSKIWNNQQNMKMLTFSVWKTSSFLNNTKAAKKLIKLTVAFIAYVYVVGHLRATLLAPYLL